MTEKAGIDDAAQSVVINDILQNRSVETAKWWLRVKCADEFNPPSAMELKHTGEVEQKHSGEIGIRSINYRTDLGKDAADS